MHNFLRKIRAQARAKNRAKIKKNKTPIRIVFPEGHEPRIIKAAQEIKRLQIAEPILLRDYTKTHAQLLQKFAQELYELRKHKGLTLPQAKKLINDPNYFATMMVQLDHADAMIGGATNHTDDTIRPALQIIKTKEKFHRVSGIFFMVLEKRLLLFADCAVNINPTAEDLTDIATDSAETAKKFGIKPKIALLSFSTKGSAENEFIAKMQTALKLIKKESPRLLIDGELQVDAALVPEVAKRKCPDSPLKGDANVLIFPDLQSANISYKLVERLAKAKAIGPILQGLKKPVNDLSRGCDAQDIVNIAAFTVLECE